MNLDEKRKAEDLADQDAIGRVLAGDRNAFAGVVRRHHGSMYRVAWRLLGDRALAEEATQEALARAYTNLGSFRGDCSARPWLFRILLNLCRDLNKSAPRREHACEDPTAGGMLRAVGSVEPAVAEDGVQRRRALEVLQQAIWALPIDQREALVMRLLEDEPYERVSEALGVPVGALKVRVHRARRRLKELLGPLLDDIISKEAA